MAVGCTHPVYLWAADGVVSAPRRATMASSRRLTNCGNAIWDTPCRAGDCPKQRSCDAIRFSVARDRGDRLLLWFVCESAHQPAGHGTLEYDRSLGRWTSSHPDPRIQKMADCYLQGYLLRRVHPAPADILSSVIHD